MKTKVILSALAASAMFAACTNDELDSIQVQNAPKTEWVALEGLEATVQVGDVVNSRLTTDGKWEATDEVGVGFVNWWDEDGNTVANKYAAGTRHANAATGNWAQDITSADLYANHRLYLNEGAWKFETVVYEGLHYAYYPLQAHKNVAPLEIELGTEQTFGEEDAFITEGLFAVSPLYDLQNDAAGKAPKASFALNTVSNRLALNIELANARAITDPIIIKNVTVNAKYTGADANIFAQEATINGSKLPVADYTNLLAWEALADNHSDKTAAKKAEAIEEDVKETAERFADEFVTNGALVVTRVAAMSTDVKGHTGLTSSAKTYGVNLIAFPTEGNVDAVEVVVTTNYGEITIEKVEDASAPANETDAEKAVRQANNKKLEAIVAILSGSNDAPKGKDNQPINFKSYGKYAGTTLLLDMKDPELSEFDIESAEDWTKAVTVASQVDEDDLTFNIKKDMAADLTNLPANVTEITIADGKTLTISGNVTTEDLTISPFTSTGKVKVAASTALTVNGTIAAPTNLEVSAAVENWGDITVGENGFLTLSGEAVNHANVINKKSLTVKTFTNHKDELDENDDDSHDCEGIVKNYATLTVSSSFTNEGTYYTIGANANVNNMTNNGTAITEEGGSFDGIFGTGAKKAKVNTPAQMELAINKATEITVEGAVSLSTQVTQTTKIVLASDAEIYFLSAEIGGTDAATSDVNIEVAGVNTKISAKNPLYVNKFTVKAGKDVTFLKDSKVGINKISYEKNSTVTNNGFGVIVDDFVTNAGAWNGLSANKKIVDGEEVLLTSF